MIHTTFKQLIKALNVILFTLLTLGVQAQDKVKVDTEQVESWFAKNWIWVAGAVLLLIIIALFSSRRNTTARKVNQRKTTTVIKDPEGNVKSITTTEDTV
jgi:protein-S-isoprenylcysteine O-methyltransferase Ste14